MAVHGHLSAIDPNSNKPRASAWTQPMPDMGDFHHLWSYLCQMGIVIGGRELSYTDIKHWSELTATPITPFQATSLAELSRIWLSEKRKGEHADAFPPWLPEAE